MKDTRFYQRISSADKDFIREVALKHFSGELADVFDHMISRLKEEYSKGEKCHDGIVETGAEKQD